MSITTREAVARQLAHYDNVEWLAYPNIKQARKQSEYLRRADEIIGTVCQVRHDVIEDEYRDMGKEMTHAVS